MPVPAGSLLTKIEAVEPISRALSRAAPLRCQSSSNTPSRTQRQNSALSRAGGLHLQPTEGGLAGALAAKLVGTHLGSPLLPQAFRQEAHSAHVGRHRVAGRLVQVVADGGPPGEVMRMVGHSPAGG